MEVGKRKCLLGDSPQGMEPATLSLLSLQTRHGPRNSLRFEARSPSSPCLSVTVRGRGAEGEPRVEIPDLQGLTKAEQGMGVIPSIEKKWGTRDRL